MYEILRCFCFKRLNRSLVDMYVKLSTSYRDYFLPFFRCFLCEGTPRSQTEVMPCLKCGNHQWRKCEPDVNKWWGLATWLESRLVTWCLWTSGRIGCKRFLTDQSRKGCFALFLEKHTACNGCFILMQCRCQIMCVHVALRKSIHFREIFERAYTDGVTTFVNMWSCCRQALIFWPINFYYFTVWCLLSLYHLKRKLFKSTMLPVEVLL